MYDSSALELCKKEIEEKFKHGPSGMWTTKDFQVLSENIHLETDVLLSVSTLKRIWNKVNYNSVPNQTTLDALAKFLEFHSWRDYENSKKDWEEKILNGNESDTLKSSFIFKLVILILILLGTIYFGLKLFVENETRKTNPNPNDFKLQSDVVSEGLPNTVVFYYDAEMAGLKDLVQLQQDWDARKRVEISRTDTVATSLYYKPGFFNAKLVVNDSIVKETEVLINSKSWVGIIDDEPTPIYLDSVDFRNGMLAINHSSIMEHGLGRKRKRFSTGYYNVGGFTGFSSSDLNFVTEFNNVTEDGYNICKNTRITLLFKGGTVSIPISEKGCSSQLSLFIFNKHFEGKSADLSSLGVNFESNQSQKLNLRLNAGELEILLNNKLAFKTFYEEKDLEFLGIVFNFEGIGNVTNLEISKSQNQNRHIERF